MGLLLASILSLIRPCNAASPDAVTSAPDAPTLVSSLKREAPARTAYTEVRFSGLLDRPLILHGELEYLGPAQLGKRVDTPYKEQVTVVDGRATVKRGERAPRTFSLNQAPELEGFLRGFAALLGGDSDGLARDFEYTASGTAASWQLRLKPRDRRLAQRISEIEVDGARNTPRCFRTREADGDVNVLLVGDLAAQKLSMRPLPGMIDALCRGAKRP